VLPTAPSQEYSLDELCNLRLTRWDAGIYKDSTWLAGGMLVHKAL
jgi:hypothetical protein